VFDVRFRDEKWRKAICHGHEIGGHNVRHRRLKDTLTGEIPASQKILFDALGVQPRSYAWPFCETFTAVAIRRITVGTAYADCLPRRIHGEQNLPAVGLAYGDYH
jgi:hypothetical protein